MYIEGGFFMYIRNGIIVDDYLEGVRLVKMITPRVTGKHRPALKRSPKSITIHNTSNPRKGADALAHGKYLENLEKRPIKSQVSWNFVVDKDRIVQCIPINEVSFCQGHARGNRESISIEICDCYPLGSSEYRKAEENAIILAGELVKYFNFSKKDILKHQDWTGKYCPARILKMNRWEEVRDKIYAKSLKDDKDKLNLVVYGVEKYEKVAAFRLARALVCPVVPATWRMDFKPYYTLGMNIIAIGSSVLHTSYRTHELRDCSRVYEMMTDIDKFKVR